MNVKEIITSQGSNFDTFEIWQFTDKTRRLHTDFIKNLDENFNINSLMNIEAHSFYIMGESEYNETICINSSVKADFAEWYDDADAKVLVIIIDYTTEIK